MLSGVNSSFGSPQLLRFPGQWEPLCLAPAVVGTGLWEAGTQSSHLRPAVSFPTGCRDSVRQCVAHPAGVGPEMAGIPAFSFPSHGSRCYQLRSQNVHSKMSKRSWETLSLSLSCWILEMSSAVCGVHTSACGKGNRVEQL